MLLTGPPGSGKTEVALARIREAATSAGPRGRGARPGGSALLVLPTYGEAQHALRSALSRWDARGLFDAPFVTFTSAGERFLPGFRVRSLPSAEERDRLLEVALAQADVPAFREVRGHLGFRARLLRLLKDVKQGAAPAATVLASLAERAAGLAPGPQERLRGFLDVARCYAGLLVAAGLEDHEDTLQRLRSDLEEAGPVAMPQLLVVDGFDDMTPVEEHILLALARGVAAAKGEVLVTLTWEEARADLFASAGALRSRLLAAGFVESSSAGFRRAPGGALERLALGLYGPVAAPVAGGDEVLLLEALDADDEADLVAREVRELLRGAGGAGGHGALVRGPRDVIIVVPDLERRGPGLERALRRLGVPVRRTGPRALAAEPWVRALVAPLTLLAGRTAPGELSAASVLDTLRYLALSRRSALDLAAVDAQEIAWRRDGYPAGWEALRAAASAALALPLAAWEQQRAAWAAVAERTADALLALLDRLLPLPGPAGLDPSGRARDGAHDQALAAALTARARVAALAQARAAAAERGGTPLTVGAAALDLLEALERSAFEPPERRLDVVHLLDPDTARGWEAAVVFVTGLEERSLPRRTAEDALLGDAERAQLGGGAVTLPTAAQREARERRRVLAVLTRARRRLVLVRALRTPEGDDLSEAAALTALRGVLVLEPRRAARSVAPGAVALVRCAVPDDLARFAAASLARPGAVDAEPALARALLGRLDPDLARRAARWRRSAADALPPEALGRLRASVERVSASKLSAAHGCAQRHFLERVVGLPQDDAPLAGPTFGAPDLGRVLHVALQRAVLRPDEPAASVALAALDAEGVTGPERETTLHETTRVVTLWRLRETATQSSFTPDPAWLEGQLAAADAAVVLETAGGRIELVGRIDRVDRDGRRAVVVDYKTGTAQSATGRKDALRGHDLQLPLYARALEVAHGLEIVGLEWVALLARSRAQIVEDALEEVAGRRKEGRSPQLLEHSLWRAFLEQSQDLAIAAVERVRAGDHALAPLSIEACDTCPMQGPCRPERSAVRAAAARRGLAPEGGDDDEGESA